MQLCQEHDKPGRCAGYHIMSTDGSTACPPQSSPGPVTDGVAMGPSLTLSSACMSTPPEGMLATRSTAVDRRLLLSAGAVRYTCEADTAVSLLQDRQQAALLTGGVVLCVCKKGGAWHLQLPTWHHAVQLHGCQAAQRPLVPVALRMRCALHLKEGKETSLCPSHL